MTKAELLEAISKANPELTKKQVADVMDALSEEIRKSIAKRGGTGKFSITGLCKIVVQRKPAKKELDCPLGCLAIRVIAGGRFPPVTIVAE